MTDEISPKSIYETALRAFSREELNQMSQQHGETVMMRVKRLMVEKGPELKQEHLDVMRQQLETSHLHPAFATLQAASKD